MSSNIDKDTGYAKFALKLRKDNFIFWSFVGAFTIKTKGLEDVVFNACPLEPLPKQPTDIPIDASKEQKAEYAEKVKNWKEEVKIIQESNRVLQKRKDQACELIINSISEEMLTYVLDCTTPHEMWNALVSYFNRVGDFNAQF
jgi:hypothetical protein